MHGTHNGIIGSHAEMMKQEYSPHQIGNSGNGIKVIGRGNRFVTDGNHVRRREDLVWLSGNGQHLGVPGLLQSQNCLRSYLPVPGDSDFIDAVTELMEG